MQMRSSAIWPRGSQVHVDAGFKVFMVFVLDFRCKASYRKKRPELLNVAGNFPALLTTVWLPSQLRSHAGIYLNTKKHSGWH